MGQQVYDVSLNSATSQMPEWQKEAPCWETLYSGAHMSVPVRPHTFKARYVTSIILAHCRSARILLGEEHLVSTTYWRLKVDFTYSQRQRGSSATWYPGPASSPAHRQMDLCSTCCRATTFFSDPLLTASFVKTRACSLKNRHRYSWSNHDPPIVRSSISWSHLRINTNRSEPVSFHPQSFFVTRNTPPITRIYTSTCYTPQGEPDCQVWGHPHNCRCEVRMIRYAQRLSAYQALHTQIEPQTKVQT